MDLQHTKVRIKICGVTNLLDTLAAMGAGADMIGFNFSPRSPRCVTVEKVSGILREAPKGFQRVGVFQDAAPDEVRRVAAALQLHFVQLHGAENPTDYQDVGVPVIKAYPVAAAADLEAAAASAAPYVLLDSRSPQGGGSGQRFDWSLLGGFSRDFFLAGGLTPENVGEAIRTARPFGVDVSSGVEKTPGRKDKALMKAFVVAARAAEQEIFSDIRGR